MRLIIAGSRQLILGPSTVRSAVAECYGVPTEIVSGCANGPDSAGERYAAERGLKLSRFPADWDAHGKAAGIIRNRQMGDYADALLAFWDGKSRGTKHMIDYMKRLGKSFVVRMVGPDAHEQ